MMTTTMAEDNNEEVLERLKHIEEMLKKDEGRVKNEN